jgi:hypothetical protein
MEESYGEGPASHTGPESCGGVREDAAETLTGVHTGQPLSREILLSRNADAVIAGGRQHGPAEEGKAERMNRDAVRRPKPVRCSECKSHTMKA